MKNNEKTSAMAIACSLQADELVKRKEKLQQLIFSKANEVIELEETFRFSFPSSDLFSLQLIEFINAERKCCPFFAFQLAFMPDQGAILLEIGGSKQAKEALKYLLTDVTQPSKYPNLA